MIEIIKERDPDAIEGIIHNFDLCIWKHDANGIRSFALGDNKVAKSRSSNFRRRKNGELHEV